MIISILIITMLFFITYVLILTNTKLLPVGSGLRNKDHEVIILDVKNILSIHPDGALLKKRSILNKIS